MTNYVMALIIKNDTVSINFSGSGEWIMVEHINRGWELPGGKPKKNECVEDAIKREVFEETGLRATIKKGPEKYEDGVVFLMQTSDNGTNLTPSLDPMIKSVKWHSKPPNNLAWGLQELNEIVEIFSLK